MLIDVIFILLVIYGFYLGFSKKVVRAVSMFFLVILALLLSLNIAPFITDVIGTNYQTDSGVLFFIGLVLSFSVAIFLIKFIMGWLENIFDKDNVGMATKLSSGLIIASIFLVFYGGGLSLLDKNEAITDNIKKEAVTYKFTTKFQKSAQASVANVGTVFEDFCNYVSGNMKDNHKRSKRPKDRGLDF